uniref:(northern house mosquito) hypothetical protein n=1 Tax=Culex pipiens TaxID=7175 RepID=A0A8D8CID9_CULPI
MHSGLETRSTGTNEANPDADDLVGGYSGRFHGSTPVGALHFGNRGLLQQIHGGHRNAADNNKSYRTSASRNLQSVRNSGHDEIGQRTTIRVGGDAQQNYTLLAASKWGSGAV